MRKQKKKNPIKTIIAVIFLTVVLAVGGYFAMWQYYEKADFICGTWINGVYCAGKSIAEVEEILLAGNLKETISIIDGDGTMQILSTTDFGELPGERFSTSENYRYSYRDELLSISTSQVPGNWIKDTFENKTYNIQPSVHYTIEEESLLSFLKENVAVIYEGSKISHPTLLMEGTENGYVLTDQKAHYLNVVKAAEVIFEAVVAGAEQVDLEEAGCYEKIPYNEADRELLELWGKISDFQDCKIVYAFGEEREAVDASVVWHWIKRGKRGEILFDKEGNLILDETKVKEYIDKLAEKYDTLGKTRQFQTTDGAIVTIEGGTYGNELDKKVEVKYLIEAFLEKKTEVREPEYKHKAWQQGANDIGNTYIEIDMGRQKMFYYVDGICEIETPIVTGNMMKRRDTPAAVCYVYTKQKNRILRGPGYASHVNFWMPVKGGIGIHDAKWRKNFGGDIYKTDGSHGCINTPYEAATKLYNLVEIGTPVVMFY